MKRRDFITNAGLRAGCIACDATEKWARVIKLQALRLDRAGRHWIFKFIRFASPSALHAVEGVYP